MDELLENKIPLEELKEGYLYRIEGRNAQVGICRFKEFWNNDLEHARAMGWKGDKHVYFEVPRWKFGHYLVDDEYEWDTHDRLGTVQALEIIEKAPDFQDGDYDAKLAYLVDKRG